MSQHLILSMMPLAARENIEALYLIGVRMFAPADDVDLYALVLYYDAQRDDRNRPLTHNGRIVFFRDFALADRVLQLGDEAFRKYEQAPSELAIVYEPFKALALVEYGEYDDSAAVINCANELLDFVGATRWALPDDHRQKLFPFLDYATVNRDFSAYFERVEGGRLAVVNALLWCFGAVCMNSVIFDDFRPAWL